MFGMKSLIADSMLVSSASSRGMSGNFPGIPPKPSDDALPRTAVIDACNIGRGASGRGRKKISCEGLLSIIRYLLVRGFDVYTYIPIHYRNPVVDFVEHAAILEHLERLQLLTFTMARRATEDRAAFQNYDDLYILGHAERCGGFVLSGDHYEDILKMHKYADMHEVIRRRRIEPLWRGNSDHPFVRFDEDRFGRRIPDLVTRAWKTSPAWNLSEVFYCLPDDPKYAKVKETVRSEQDRLQLIAEIDKLMDELENTGTVHSLSVSNSTRQLFHRSNSFPVSRSHAEFESTSVSESEERFSELFSIGSVHELLSPSLPDAVAEPPTPSPTPQVDLAESTAPSRFYLSEGKENEGEWEGSASVAPLDLADGMLKGIRLQLLCVFEEWLVEQAMDERPSIIDISLIADRCTEILDSFTVA